MAYAFFVILSLFLITPINGAFGNSDGSAETNGSGSGLNAGYQTGGRHNIKQTPQANSARAVGSIQGTCMMVSSASNPLEGPCANLLLVLKDGSGSEVSKVRTDAQGHFEFAAEAGKMFSIVSGSRYYDVISQKNNANTGVEIRIQQKS